MRLFYFFFVTFFFGGIVKVQNVVITQDEEESKKGNPVLDELFLDYERMVDKFKDYDDPMKKEMRVPVVDFRAGLRPTGYDFLKIINEHDLTDNDLKIYMEKLYEYFNNIITEQLKTLEKHKQLFEQYKTSIQESTQHLQQIQNTSEGDLTPLYAKYQIEEKDRNVSNLIEGIKKRVEKEFLFLKDIALSFDKWLLIKHLPKYFKELIKEFQAKNDLLKDTFDKIKELNTKMEKEDIDDYKTKRQAEIPPLERSFTEASNQVNHLITKVKPSSPSAPSVPASPSTGGADDRLPADSPSVPTDGSGNPSSTPSDGTDNSHSSERTGEDNQDKKNKIKEHHTKISELLKNYKKKIAALSSKNNPNDQSIKDGNISNVINISNISNWIAGFKNNEQELTEVTKDLETLVTQIQNEKAAMDELYNKLEEAGAVANDTETEANIASAKKTVNEFLGLKKEAEHYLTKLTGGSSSSLRRTNNEMMLTIRNVIAILMIITFIF